MYMYVCMCVCMFVYECVYVCVCIYIYIYIQTCIHINTHTQYGVDSLKRMLLASLDESNVAAAAQYAHHIECSDIMLAARRCAQMCLPSISREALAGVSAHVAAMLMSAYKKGGMPLFWFADRCPLLLALHARVCKSTCVCLYMNTCVLEK